MVAIFTGNGLGIERGSGMVLGSRGLVGQSSMGRAGENIFVNAANGNLVVTRGDEFLMGLGLDAPLARTYNSQGNASDDNADNWRTGAARRVLGYSAGVSVTRTDWDGSETVYLWQSGNVYRSTEGAGAYDTLTYDGSSSWTWQDGNSRNTELYDTLTGGMYRLASQTNLDGKTVTFGYTSARLTSITTISTPTSALTGSGKEFISLAYDGSGNLTDIVTNYQADTDTTYETVKRVKYTYTSNKLTKVTVDLSPDDGTTADGKVYEIAYGYDGSGRVNVISQTDGSRLAITYDGSARVSSLVQSVDGTATRTTSFDYSVSGQTTVTDPFNQQTTLTYDTAGQLTSIVSPPAVSGGSSQTYSFTYNNNGDVITVVDPSGKKTTYDDTPNAAPDSTGYDGNGNRRLERDYAGNTVSRTFGSNNELLTETRYTTPDPDGNGAGSASGGLTTNFVYDSELHLRYVVSAEGHVTEHQYNADGYRTSDIEHTGATYASTMTEAALDTWVGAISDKTARNRTDFTYDFRGQLDTATSFSVCTSTGVGDTSADVSKTHYLYGPAGQLLSRWIDGSSFKEALLYDGLNRITSATELSGLNATTTFTYTSTNSVTTVVVGGVLTKTSTYNLAGELVAYAESGADVSTATTAYRYDALGRLRGITDPTGVKSYILYDGVGRKVAEINGSGSLVEYKYNADNELVATVRYKTLLNSTQLSDLNGIDDGSDTGSGNADVVANFRPSADSADIWEWRIYDDAHRLIETIDGLGAATRFEYDGISRLVKTTSYTTRFDSTSIGGFKTTPPTSFTSPGTNSSDRVTRYFYDDDARLEYKFDAEGYLTKLVYDAAGQLAETIAFSDIGDTSQTTLANIISSVSVSSSTDIHNWSIYDGQGVVRATINGEGDVVRYHYTALGHLDQEIRGQKLTSGQLTSAISTRYTLATLPAAAGGTVLETTAWTRDAAGKVLTETRNLASGTELDVYLYDSFGHVVAVTTASGSAAARTKTYRYDARGRLVAELWGEGSAIASPHMGYTYDQSLVGTAGNDTTVNGGAGRDRIQGLAGNDTIHGNGGGDLLEGGAGADKLYGDDGNDVIISGIGIDTILSGGAGRDIFVFSAGDGADTITDFEVGLDLIDLSALGGYVSYAASGTGGVDTTIVLSNAGSIVLTNVNASSLSAANFLTTAYDTVPTIGTAGNDTLNGTSGRDLIFGVDSNDTINGLGGDDRLEGGANVDAINGGDGDDVIISGTGNDISLTGGDGRDTFVFNSGDGADVVLDFKAGVDIIDLTAIGGYSAIAQVGADVLVTTASGGGTITVKNIALADLTSAHFLTSGADAFRAFGNTYTYDNADRLISKTTSDGAGTTGLKTLYYYNTEGQLVYEINALGEVVEYRYDAFGRRTDVVAYGGYDSANPTVTGRIGASTLATLSGGLVNSTATSAVAALARSSFDSRTQSAYDVGGNLTSVTDAIGRVTTLEYNAFHEATAKVDPLSSSATRRTEFAYNVRGLVTQQIVDPTVAGGVPELNLVTQFGYDAFGNQISSTDPDGNVRATDYDRAGRTWKTRNPYNAETTYEYDGRSHVIKIKDALTNETVFTHNEFDRVVTMTTQEGFVTKTTNNTYGQTVSVVEGFGTSAAKTTTFTYDRDGNLRDTTNGTGGVVRQGYDRAGRLAYVFDGRNGKTTYAYDAANRMVTKTVDDGVQNFKTTYEFDAKGQAIKITDGTASAAIKTQRIEFDQIGRTTKVIVDPSGLALTTTYQYDQVDATDTTTKYGVKATEAYGTSIARVTLNTFDRADRLVKSQVDPSGLNLTTAYAYDDRGNAVARTDATGRITHFVYDNDNRLIWSVDPAGAAIKSTYDAMGRVTSVRAYATLIAAGTVAGWPAELVEGTHLTSGIIPPSGNDQITRYVYDRDGRLRYSADSLGHPVEFIYNAVGSLIRKVEYAGAITPSTWTTTDVAAAITSGGLAAAAGTRTTRSTYDGAGRQAFSVDATGGVVSFTYDGNGDISLVKAFSAIYSTSGDLDLTTMQGWATTHASDAGNRTSRTVYDGAGRIAFTVNPTGGVAAYTYDALGNVVQTRAFGVVYAGTGTFADLTTFATTNASSAHISRAAYDAAGRLAYSVDAAGVLTALSYDAQGEVVQSRVFAAPYTTSGALDIATMATWASANAGSSDRINRFVRDLVGRAVFGIDAANAITTYGYDSAGRVVKAIRFSDLTYSGDGSLSNLQTWATTHASDADNRLSRTIYDVLGQAAYEVDALGYVIENRYDAFGQLTQQIRYAVAYTVTDSTTQASLATLIGTLPSTAAVTSYAYDATGHLTDITDALGAVTHMTLDAFGQATAVKVAYGTADEAITTREYDTAGRVTKETRGATTADAADTTYTYNAYGQVATVTNGMGFVTQAYTYDTSGRVLTQTVQLASGVNAVTTNQYDVFGNLVKVNDPRGFDGFFYYNALNQLTLQVDPEGYGTETGYSLGGEAISVKRYYNKANNSYSVTTKATFTTHANDATTTIGRDKLDRVISTADALSFSESYTLDAFGGRKTVTNRLGWDTNYTYDKLGHVLSETLPITTKNSGGSDIALVNTYEYDARGNRTKSIEATGAVEQRTTTFVYDKLDRLTQEIGDLVVTLGANLTTTTNVTPTQTITYDLRGNIIGSTDAAGVNTVYYYDDLDRKTFEIDALGTYREWQYDLANNVKVARVYETAVTQPAIGAARPSIVNPTLFRETKYDYDRNNRLITTTIESLRTGEYGASSYATSTGSVITSIQYDAAGNVVKQTDGRGNGVFSYYDKDGRKVAQVDQEKYVTTYTRDSEGNATQERRYATKYAGTPAVTTTVATLISGLSNAADRITNFTYDKVGQRLTEVRVGVASSTINSSTGVLTSTTPDATITYTYDGLGNVLTKVEANSDTTNFTYDKVGRQTKVEGAAFTDYSGATSIRHTIETTYDGLNNVIKTRDGKSSADSAIDRITTYVYGAGGRLASTTDAAGFQRTYAYDAVGRVVKEGYVRTKSDGTTSLTEANAYRYDVLGRITYQAAATYASGSWSFGDSTQMQYNVFGEVSAKGVNGLWQEAFTYDKAGRMWKSTAGDGTSRLYIYDANGKVTLTISSTGTNLSGTGYATIEEALTTLGVNGATGVSALSGIAPTITVYDKRGLAITTRENFRELTTSTTGNIVRSKTYNAFGEVASETDALSKTTTFTYNTMGKLTQKVSPQVSITSANGTVSNTNPTENYYYDVSGRLIGVEDANSNLSSRLLLAGTGHGDDEALVLSDFHAGADDSNRYGIFQTGYDVFGDARKLTNEVGNIELRDYDAMSRLTVLTRPTRTLYDETATATGATVALVEHYGYDQLGRRTTHWNSQLGSTVKETTDYDAQGRVTKSADYMGHLTQYAYAWNATLVTNSSLTTFGGWEKTITHVSGLTAVEKTDYFGRMLGRTDLGGHVYSFVFDVAGRLTDQTSTAGQDIDYTYFNTGQLKTQVDNVLSATATYGYDLNGARTRETYVVSGTTLQNSTAVWDAMGRMTSYAEAATGQVASVAYAYDAAGNIRKVAATYSDPVTGTAGNTQTYWYTYDTMNRVAVTKGTFNGTAGSGNITAGTTGALIVYDAAGRRVSVSTSKVETHNVVDPEFHTVTPTDFLLGRTETYTYTEDGHLATVSAAEDVWNETIHDVSTNPSNLQVVDIRDAMGRLTSHNEYRRDPSTGVSSLIYRRTAAYNDISLVTSDEARTWRIGQTDPRVRNTYTYTALSTGGGITAGAFLGGAVTYSETLNDHYRVDESGPYNDLGDPDKDTSTTTTLAWWDDAKQSYIVYDRNIASPNTVLWTTTVSFDVNGRLTQAVIDDGVDRTVYFTNDTAGQVLKRREVAVSHTAQVDNPIDRHYYFAGKQIGATSNNGAVDQNYVDTLASRGATGATGSFRYGTAVAFADFDQSFTYVNTNTPKAAASAYTAGAGDSLTSIAQAMWGDASLWYLIADANGLTGSDSIAAGMTLSIPSALANVHNNSTTFRPYDPNTATGNIQPTQVKPPPKPGGCGGMGVMLVAIIAVVVTAIIAPYALTAMANVMGVTTASGGAITVGMVKAAIDVGAGALLSTVGVGAAVAGGAIAGAIGSIVSQGIGVATGMQDKFSWNAVGMAALGAAVGAGVGNIPIVKGLSNWAGQAPGKLGVFASYAVRGAASSIITQGIGVATGMQDEFDWAGVAVNAVASGVAETLGDAEFASGLGDKGQSIVNNMIGGFAGVAARSLVEGSDFGDNLASALPGIIGNTIGDMIARSLTGSTLSQGEKQDKDNIRSRADENLSDFERSTANNIQHTQSYDDPYQISLRAFDSSEADWIEISASENSLALPKADMSGLTSGFGRSGVAANGMGVTVSGDGYVLSTTWPDGQTTETQAPIKPTGAGYYVWNFDSDAVWLQNSKSGAIWNDSVQQFVELETRFNQSRSPSSGPGSADAVGTDLNLGQAEAIRNGVVRAGEGVAAGAMQFGKSLVGDYQARNHGGWNQMDYAIRDGMNLTRERLEGMANARNIGEYLKADWGGRAKETLNGLRFVGGAFEWLGSPVLGPVDTIVGRPVETLTRDAPHGTITLMGPAFGLREFNYDLRVRRQAVTNVAAAAVPLVGPARRAIMASEAADAIAAAKTLPARLTQDIAVSSKAPIALSLRRPIGLSPTQNAAMQAEIVEARAAGATDFRVNQQQVNAMGERIGINRPDLQYTDVNGRRVYIEYDTPSSTRGAGHEDRIRANDPAGHVILRTVE